MEEYLRRQRKEAERHIRNSPLAVRKHSHGILSMPGTPTGSRRSAGGAADLLDGDGYQLRLSRGGSLERQSPARFQAPRLFRVLYMYSQSFLSFLKGLAYDIIIG
jgi:hypothetical protein